MIEIDATATRLGFTVRRGGSRDDTLTLREHGVDVGDPLQLANVRMHDDEVPVLDRHRLDGPRFGRVTQLKTSGDRVLIRAQLHQWLAQYFTGGHYVELSAGLTCGGLEVRDGVQVATDAVLTEVSFVPKGAHPGCLIHAVRQL